MASGGAEEEDGCVPLDIDNVHMLLQVEHEQIQKRTFTNWINAQLAKKCPPSFMSDLFSDLKDGSRLLDLLEVLSGQHMKRQRGRGVFQQRANIETALNFLKKKNVKLVNINIPDIIDGRPSIILGLVWTIILHCHIEELANALSFSSRHSSLDSLASLDSWSGSPVPSSPVPGGRASPLHRRFRVTAKKALLMWVRDQCQRVGCSISVKDFKASWRSGQAFLAILCALRPELVDLSAARHRSHRENLEEAFLLAEKELHIPRLLEPQDVDVKDPEEKSIMTYVAQFLQYSNDMPAPDEHEQLFPPLQPSCFSPVNLPSHYTPAIAVSPLRQASPSERAREVTCWLQQAKQELSESWESADKSSYTEKYQVFQSLAGSFSEQRKPVLTLLTSIRRCPELVQEQQALKAAWDHLEEQLQRCKSDLDLSVPPPLDTVVVWLQRAEALLTEEGDAVRDHADAAKEARSQQEMLKTLCREMSRQVNTLDTFHNMDESGNLIVPSEKFDEIKRRLTNVRVTAKYQGIKLEYRESRHTVLDLLSRISAKLQVWRAPYVSQEAVRLLLQDWHETVERQGVLLILQDALQSLQRRADAYTSKAALGDDSQLVCRQAKEAAGQAAAAAQAAVAARAAMERAEAAWEMYEGRLGCLQAWLARANTQDVGEWASCHAQLNEAGNLLIEVTEAAVGRALAQQLSGVNMQWAEHMKRSVFEASPGPSAALLSLHAVGPLVQEAGWLLRQPLQVSSLPLKANRQKMQLLLKKLTEVEALSSVAADKENLQTLTKMLAEGERSCGELQSAASRLEGGLAELQRWSSEALDCQQKLREAEQRGRAALERSARTLVTRGIQLQKQVMTDGEDLQNLVDHIQRTSPLLHISAAASQERSSQAVCQSQEVLARFRSLGFLPPAGEIADVQRKEEGGSLVVVKTKRVEQAGSVKLQLIPPAGFPPSHDSLVKPHKVVQVQSVRKADAGGDVPPAGNQPPTAATSPQSPPLSKPTTPSGSPPVQKPKLQLQAATKEPSDASKRSKAPPRPPVMDRGEVLSRAQSMARSRLEKARSRLQGRIQQAIKLFGGRGVSETQARRKQRALKVLQPELLLEFLVAVDGYAAFCSEPQLRELMLLSDSVRKQWEDVRSEMAEFVPILRSHIRLDKQSLSAAEREIQTNRMLHEAAMPLPPPPQQQVATEGAPSAEEGVETLQQLCETLLPGASSCLATDQLKESDETQETKPRVAALPDGCRGQQLLGGPPPTATGTPADRQHNNNAAQSQEGSAESGWLGAVKTQTPTQDAAVETGRPLMLRKAPARSCLRDPSKEQALKARVLHVAEANQQVQTHIQTVVRGDTVETKQEAEWTVIPEAAGASSQQEVVERYRTSFTVPQNQLWSEPGSGSARSPLHRENQPEALCFHPELQYTQRSQFPQLVMGEDSEEAETEQVREQWRGRQMMTQTSRASLAGSSDLTEEQMALISEDLDLIFKQPVDISSWTSADPRLISDLKDLDDKLPSDTRKQSEERGGPEITSSSSVCQLRRRLEPLQSASRSLARFLAAAREARAEISNPLPIRDPSGRQEQAEREQERRSWQADVLERAGDADGALKAAGMNLTLDGAAVMCWDLAAALLSQKVADKEREPTGTREERQLFVQQEPGNTCDGEEESGLQAKRSKLEDARALGEEALEEQRRRGRSSHAGEKTSALIGALKELQAAAEQLGLQEPTLPALQQRTRALRRIESQLASRLPELHQLRDADGSQTSEVEEVWEETSKAVVDRLDECGVLTDLLKRFQSTRDMLSCTLQRGESAIGEQASYVGRDYLQRLHTKVQETKAELNGLGAGIEEVRTTCRQLHTHLRKIPQCTANPFEGEADALMDRWLDISERTDSHLDNLHLALTLWDGVLQLGAELESRADNKLSVFAESPSLHSQEDIRALQNEIATQEESVERFHRRAAEIQALLQSAEPPLELQVVETQMRKKVEELRELVSDAEEVSQQMTATKKQISDRMSECCSSLQRIQTSLLSDAEETPEKLKAVCVELQTQQQHAERLLEDVCVLASIASPDSLHTLTADGARLQGEVRATRRLYSELEETNRLQKASEETAAKAENPSFVVEETHRCRATTETLSLQSCWPRQAAPVRLVGRHQSIRTGELDEQTHEAVNGMNGVKGDVSTLTLARDLRGRQRPDCDAVEELGVSVCDGSHLKMENKETTQEAADSLAASLRHQTPPFPWPGSAQRERVLQPRDRAELLQPGRAAELQGVCDEERAGRRELSPLQEGTSACQSSAGRDAEDAALQVALHGSIMDNLEVMSESSRQSVRTQGEVETLAGKRPAKQEVLLGTKVQLDGGQRDVEVDGEAAGPASPLTFIKSTSSLDNRRPSTESGDSNQQLVATSLYRDESKASPSTPTNADAKDDVGAVRVDPLHQGNVIFSRREDHVEAAGPEAQADGSKTDAQEAERCYQDIGVTPNRVFTVVLDVDLLNHGISGASESLPALPPETSKSQGVNQPEKAAENKSTGGAVGESFDPESKDTPGRFTAMMGNTEHKSPSSLEATEEQQTQIQVDMEAAEAAGGCRAVGVTGGSAEPGPGKRSPTMQDVLSEIQELVEKGDVINRTPHVDLKWYLQSSPGEAEIRLARTVQKVLACRYQPAQLDVTAMAKQLEEAEDYESSVLDQVAQMKETGSAGVCDPSVLKRVEAQWNAALLDASATVQVKAAQLDQVRRYHRQMKMAKAFLEVVAVEREKMSLNALGSSALQAVKLQALLNTMAQKKGMWPELLQLSRQFSVHLSNAESSGALLAQLGDVQDEWRVLEGSIKRGLRHAANSASQAFGLIKEVKQLKDKVEAVQESLQSSWGTCDTKSTLEFLCLTTDLKLYNQLHLHLKSQSDALIHFSLGQKEKDEVKCSLHELGTLLSATNFRLNSIFSGVSLAKISKHFQDLITWAKQAENHITVGKKLSLFPEEARVQIIEMKKFQTDIFTRRSKIQVEEMKAATSDMVNEDHDQVLKTIEDLYEAITDSLDHVLNTIKKNLQDREKLLSQLANMDAWLAETHAKRDPCIHVENLSKADIGKLENELNIHKLATAEIENQLHLLEAMEKTSKETAIGLSPGESRYLVNRHSGLWTELDGMLAHERATTWELEELIHERTSSDEELSTIWESLRKITMDLEQQKFPLTEEALSAIAQYKHMLIEHQCEVQEIQHCKEAKRSSLLCTIGELQDRCKAFSIHALEQDKYLHLRKQMEDSRDIAEEQIQLAADKTLSLGERFRLCQVLLVELPLVKTQCQEAADQLEAIAPELNPSELNSERQRIRSTVETLVSWEHSVLDNIKHLETKLLLGLRFSSELPALTEVFQRARLELQGAEPVSPDEKSIDVALRRCWVIWRNMESGMRVLEALGRRDKINLKNLKELFSLRDASMQECHSQMEGLSQARESLKDYQWAAQGAIGFLHNAETTFLSAPGGFLDCTEEQRQTQQAIEALEDGFQAHICHLGELVPQQPCLSRPKTEQLHISILSQLLVGRAILEAQAQLRLESLQRCEVRQQSHKSCHEDIRQRLSGFEADLSECAVEHITSYDKCIAQHKRAKVLMEDLHGLARNIEELRAGCPMQSCAAGKDGEVGALWRRWVSLRRGVGLFMAHTEQRGEEWRDITTSMEQCCSLLASLQAEVPDSSTVSFTQEKPQKLLAQAEMHQAGLEQEQQALASLEHRLEHALSLSSSQDPVSPGPVGKTLVKIQENVRSLKERNLLVVAVAEAEERERQQVEEKMEEVERHILDILPMLETCSDPLKQQEFRSDLFSQRAKLKSIMDGMQGRYAEIPADISRRIQGIQHSLQGAEEKLTERSDSVRKLASRVAELGSGLDKVKELLETRSSDVSGAQNTLKRVWDELDMWHGRLMLLDNEVQDLAEDQPKQAHLFMDQLMQPLQLYQSAAQMAEQRTAFLSKIPACLQEFEDILHSATCWLDEARSWLNAPATFTTARSLQNHANSLQVVVDDSERIRDALHNFRPVLAEISTVCDISLQESRLEQNHKEVHMMQQNVLEPLELLLHAVVAVEDMEAEIKCIEKNISKIRAILSSMDNSSITLTEHLQNRQVILANLQSMRKTLEEMQSCKAELRLPQRAEDSLVVFNRTGDLLQSLTELEELTQQQAAQLEDQIRHEEESSKDHGVAASPRVETAQQECNSEEEESEEDSSYLSSSSDTLTCSIPEDPDDTLNCSDLQSLCDVTGSESLDLLGSEVKARSKGADELPPVTSELEIKNSGPAVAASKTMDSKPDPQLDTTETFLLSTAPSELLAVPTAELVEQLVVVAAPNHLGRDASLTDTLVAAEQTAAAEENTALIPEKPITPITVVCTSAAPGGRERGEVGSTDHGSADESQRADESSEVRSGSDDEDEQQRWHRLRTQISQKLSTLVKVQEEQQAVPASDSGAANGKVPNAELLSTGSASAVLQQTSESMDLLKSTANSADGVKEGLYVAARRVLLCLDSLTDLLLTPRGSAGDDAQLRLLQHQCLSGELQGLCGLLGNVESESRAALEGEEPDAVLCLTSLQQCLQTAQLILTGAQSRQPIQHLELQHTHQELFSDQLCALEEFELRTSEIFPNHKQDAASIEQCMLGRHQSERPGEEELALQKAAHSLLQGIAGVLELSEGWMMEEKMICSSSSSQLQSALCKHKKLSQLLASQLAFAERLFHQEPKALSCQEDERVQLEVRAKAWQQQAFQQEVAAQGRLQEWICWEDSCGRLGRTLDELEGYISGGEPEGEEEEETVVESRAQACQQTLLQLDQSRAAVGLILDQGSELQAGSAKKTGAALELRWRNARRRTEREIQRCRDIRESRASFQTDSAHVSEWLHDANKRLKTWSDLASDTEPNPECVRRTLIELLEFSSEVEAASARKTSASHAASRLLHLRDADCPGLRAHLAKLEVGWSRLTSDLSAAQDALQQRLLAGWPPAELVSDVEGWMKKLEVRLKQEGETLLKAKDAAEVWMSLRHHQELKAGVLSAQLLLDFLSQTGPQVSDVQALRSKRTLFAEQLGDLRLRWLHLQGELESQIRRAEQIHHTCADRERRLRRLSSSAERRQKQLNEWKRAGSRTLAHRALLELQAVMGNLKEEAAALQELKAASLLAGEEEEKEKELPCKVAFSAQAESVAHAFEDLSQQMEALKPALRQTVEEWARLNGGLRDVSLLTTRVRCALQHPTAPLLSVQQTSGYVDFLQGLQETAGEAEQLWAGVDESYQNLKTSLHPATVETLRDQLEGGRNRWREALQELSEEQRRSSETLSLWQEHQLLSHSCSRRLEELRGQWAELRRGGEVMPQALETLQGAAEDLQSSVGNVLTSSKPLVGRLQPLAASLVQSETRLLSRDVLLLSQDTSARKKSLQEDEAQQRAFDSQLEELEKQTQNVLTQQKAGTTPKDSVTQQLSELSELFPSLVDTLDASRCLSLSDQQGATLRRLSSLWSTCVIRVCGAYREQLKESQRSLDFEQKCASLTSILEELEKLESTSRQPQNDSHPQKILSNCQKLQMDVMTGQQLLQGLVCDAVKRLEKQTGEERSALLAHVTRLRERWFRSVSVAGQRRVSAKEQLKQWRIYQRGSKLLWKLLRDVGLLLPPAAPARSTLQQLRSHAGDCQCVEDALRRHSPVYTQTLEAGRHLCDAVTEPQSRSRLQSELQAMEETWKSSNSLLEKRGTLLTTALQKWSQCQDGITSITSELDVLKAELKKQLPAGPEQTEEEEKLIQKTGHSLQLMSGGLRELVTMKSDLSQYVAAGDSALLEQQLEQLHGQWEELCSKVSLRRQEIADRLNAWTIFNDKNKEFCDWLTQMENKVCHSGELSIEEMVEKLKKDCMEEINLFSENKSHLKQLGEQLLLASNQAKQTQVRGSLQELNQRWHGLFHHIEARVKKLKETLVTVQQLDKNMSNLRSWLSRIEAELSRPITYSVCHHQEIQRRLAEQQELQRDIEQHTEGVASVLSLCDVLLRDEDAAGGGSEAESDSLQETSRSLDQRWRTICAMALDRRLRIEETWRLWCKFLDDYSRFEDWLKVAERTAANPNSGDVLYTDAKEELKKFEGFQRQVHERLTQLELVNNQYRRLARENRTDRASQLKAMVHEGNRRWDALHRRAAAILRRLKYFTSQREDFESTRESMLVWLTELDLQLTNVEHFSESDVHHKIQQLNSFQKEITLNTERIDGLIVFGEGLIQRSSPQDAALIEDELEELHSYCQEVFSRLVRFHQRLSQPPIVTVEPELSGYTFSLESSLELIGRPWLGRSQGSLPATPSHVLASPMERSGRETPVSVDSLPLEWDHTGDVGGSSSHEDEEEEERGEGLDEDGTYFSAISEAESTHEDFVEAAETRPAADIVASHSMNVHESPRWRSPGDGETEAHIEAPPTLTSTPLKQGYLRLMSQCSGSIESIKRVSLILDEDEPAEERGLTGLSASDKQSGVIERWELLQAQSRSDLRADPEEPQTSDLDDITSWLEGVIPQLDRLRQVDPAASVDMASMAAQAKELKEMQKTFTRYKSFMLSVNLRALEPLEQERLAAANRDWSRACTGLQQWDTSLRGRLMRCQEFHETLHSLLLWLAHAGSSRYAMDVSRPDTPTAALQQQLATLTTLQEELRARGAQQASLQALWAQLQPDDGAEESAEAHEKIHVTGCKLKLLLREVGQDVSSLQRRLECESASGVGGASAALQAASHSKKSSSTQRERRDSSPPRSFFSRVLRAAFPLHLLLLLLLLLPCLVLLSESDHSCSEANNFARSFYPMLRYTNGPPPT